MIRNPSFAGFIKKNKVIAEILANTKIRTKEDMILAANKLIENGARNVLVKGGHLDSKFVLDVLVNKSGIKIFKSRRYKTANTANMRI